MKSLRDPFLLTLKTLRESADEEARIRSESLRLHPVGTEEHAQPWRPWSRPIPGLPKPALPSRLH